MLNVDFELGKPIEKKPMIWTFVLPILALVVVTIVGFYYTGAKVGGESLIEKLGNADAATALLWGAFAMTLVGVVIALSFKLMTIAETMKTILEGFKLMLLACAILVLAWSIGTVTKDMNLAGYVVSAVGKNISFVFVPTIIFVVGMLISFATGTSWGDYGYTHSHRSTNSLQRYQRRVAFGYGHGRCRFCRCHLWRSLFAHLRYDSSRFHLRWE